MFSQFSIGNFYSKFDIRIAIASIAVTLLLFIWKEIIIRQQQKDVIGYIRGSNRPLRQEVVEEKTEKKSRILQI